MLRIKSLKIEIETSDKKFGRTINFQTKGLNIIKGDNHSGKSTIASSIFYALGMEELLGGRNISALDSILTTKIPYGKELDLDIKTSKVLLEIQNEKEETIILTRYIKHYDIEPRIVEVNSNGDKKLYFLHDGGSASRENGFYNFLENFLGLNLPIVPTYEGGETKLYLQIIFNAFFTEQIKGWTDFFAAIPNFGIKDSKKRIIEYILNLDTFEYEKRRNNYENTKKEIILKWEKQAIKIKEQVENTSGIITGFPKEVMGQELLSTKKYEVFFKMEDEKLTLNEYLKKLIVKKNELEANIYQPKSRIEEKILKLKTKLKASFEILSNSESEIKLKHKELQNFELEEGKIDLKIKDLTDLLKIEKYSNTTSNTAEVFKGKCPTCKNPISESVYKNLEVMGLKENKEYIKSQKDILVTYIKLLKKEIENEENYYKQLQEEYEADKGVIEYLEKDFISNKNLPSMAIMKELLNIENNVNKITRLSKDLVFLYKELKDISEEWDKNEKAKDKYQMSSFDINKLNLLQSSFKILLKEFKYDSKRDDQISISKQEFSKYFPVVTIEDGKPQNIKHNSSASDFVRSIWAYLISLYEVSSLKNGNHLGLFLFDEPAQHAMTEPSQTALFKKLSKLNCQSLVFASFEDVTANQRDKFDEIVKDFKKEIKVIEIGSRAIIELKNRE